MPAPWRKKIDAAGLFESLSYINGGLLNLFSQTEIVYVGRD
jgi:hypothetical protein